MKYKLKLDYKNFFKYGLAVILLINCLAGYYFYKFFKKNVYDTIYFKNISNQNSASNATDINIEKFESIINKIENKGNQSQPTINVKDIFN